MAYVDCVKIASLYRANCLRDHNAIEYNYLFLFVINLIEIPTP